MNELRDLTERIRSFSEAREWEQFHNPKNLAMALIAEAAELVEQFQWLTLEEASAISEDEASKKAAADEIADVAIYLLRLADVLEIDMQEAVVRKLEMNEERFPASSRETSGSIT